MFRYAVFSAVSTDAQAHDDKASLEDQVETARRAGNDQGGTETAGPFVLDGFSRSGYVNLSDALDDIPPLADAIEAAVKDQYDVLIVDNIERLGDLAPMISTLMKKHRKQIHSARQPSRIFNPDSYNPYADESSDIMIHVEGIVQGYRVNKLRRGWSIGVPNRVKQGLTPMRVPFGYKAINSKQPPELDPAKAALLLQMKDLLLAGRSVLAIARHAENSGIRPPTGRQWNGSSVRYILANPYYAGMVSVNRTKFIFDATRKNKRRSLKQPRSKWVTGQGKHEPLWDEATHYALVNELARRREVHKKFSVRFPLSGILVCSECGQKLYRRNTGSPGYGRGRYKVLTCANGPSHVIMPYESGLAQIARELAAQLASFPHEASPEQVDSPKHYQAALDDVARRRKRIQDGYEGGLYTQAEAAEKLGELDRQVETLEQQTADNQRQAEIRSVFFQQVQDRYEHLTTWIQEDDPEVVNRLLMALCEKITVSPDLMVEFHWRT